MNLIFRISLSITNDETNLLKVV